ncbi:zf-HC2 domain-containing protein [Effusibacillus pohliae]|uniref:zf-HC2 domain-containing protein n=1 Tax=Effusibacillus pohliae TaxID=232270 RepID=UPI000368278B|nr:zf-HC2 domain-containing protein [Effusibacillus pohliae]
MTNWHVEDRLSAYLANELDPAENDFIESHLAICPACRKELELLQELEQMLDRLPLADPGPDFADAVMARLQADIPAAQPLIEPVERTRRASFWRGSDFRNMAASVVAAFMLFQGFAGLVPKLPAIDATITGYKAEAIVKLEIWLADITRTLQR